MTHEEWRASRNTSSDVSKEVMQKLMDLAAETEGTAGQDESCMLWTDEEELISSSPRIERAHSQEGGLHSVLLVLAMFGAAASLIAILRNSLRSSSFLLWPEDSKKASSSAGGHPKTVHTI